MLTAELIIFAVSCAALVISAGWCMRSAVKIASCFKLSEFAIGFIIVAISTSIPELFVGITSAFNKTPELALGTVIGSNIADLTLVLGIAVLLGRGIKIKAKAIKRSAQFMLLASFLPVVLMLDGMLSRYDGIFLLLVFCFYIRELLGERKEFRKRLHAPKKALFLSIALFVISIALLLLSSEFVVKSAVSISDELLVPPILIGLFLVAIGTSLPELIFETRAVLKKHKELALGDVIGSVVANSTLVLGATSLIYPITANMILFFSSTIFMLAVAAVFVAFAKGKGGFTIKDGILLLLFYILFIFLEFFIKNAI